jgi:hypothetical protein
VGGGLGPWAGPARPERAGPVQNSNNTGLFGLGPGQAGRPECTPIIGDWGPVVLGELRLCVDECGAGLAVGHRGGYGANSTRPS